MDEIERAIQTKTKMDLHAKAVSLGLTHLKDWKHTWRRFTIWQSSAKKTRKESGKTGAGKQRKRTGAEQILDEIDDLLLKRKGLKSHEEISVGY